MAQDQTRNAKTYEAYTVAVVCAIEFEMSAVRYMLDEEHQRLPNKPGDSNRYILGQLSGHDTVLAWLSGLQGKSAAAIVAANLDRTFPSIKWRFLTGIGGGVPEAHDIRLGDVVVSMPNGRHGGVVQYDLGKDVDGGFQVKGFLAAPPTELRSAVCEMKSDHRVNDNKVQQFILAMLQKGSGLDDYRRPPSASDVLFAAGYRHVSNNRGTCKHCDQEHILERVHREYSSSKIHYGLIASGDRVMRSAVKRDLEVQSLSDDVLCFEMEAAGLTTEFPYIVIRGISDYADSHKNDAWQHYAAAAAAACTKEVLTYLDPVAPAATNLPCNSRNGARVSASFSGSGIQNLGAGNISVGRDVNIGKR
ncbi:nucleoside phosphorylase domain-containing protein [Xylaria digitata]|nr:nucleoside phosphorylase domain-containing protein [Xylaria digitata]